ncbi:reactive intermediate/imine deaminase [Candidatus Heimdallarchaeota archaeon B3_Heim]|nr:MAG: reactive intermediate/imine deaminase [Candidatus Heimdallarchaeota archaeon B3_Heim]
MVEVIKTDKGTPPGGYYSQGIKAGDFLFTAGQIAYNPETKKLINENIEDETRQVMQNLSAIAEAAGTTLKNTVKTTVFLTDMRLFDRFNTAYSEFFPENPPARSTVQVGPLLREVHLEIEAIIYCLPES